MADNRNRQAKFAAFGLWPHAAAGESPRPTPNYKGDTSGRVALSHAQSHPSAKAVAKQVVDELLRQEGG